MMRRAQPWLGTLVEISVAGGAADAGNAAFAEVARVHKLMSFHNPASDVSRVNRAAPGDVVEVEADTWRVLALAAEVTRLSDGVFDIGCAPRLVEYGLLPSPAAMAPEPRPAADTIALCDDRRVHKLAPGWIDVGGIAKGYAVDLAVAALVRAGASAGCVNAGGDMRVFGGCAWPVTVRSPSAPGQAGARLQLRDEAMATSGSYFSRRLHNGAPVSALLDARTGTALASQRSASVRAACCAVADALTKVALVTGEENHPALQAFGATAFII